MRIINHKAKWILSLVIIKGTCLLAGTLELTNGDRLTGKFIKEENDTIFFVSDILGPIRVNTSQGKIIPSIKGSEEEKTTDAAPILESVTETEKTEAEMGSQSTKILKLPKLNTMLSDAPPEKKLDSSFTAGYRLGNGERNQQDLNLAFHIRHDTEKNQYFFDGSYDYSFQKINGEKDVNRERYNTSFRMRRDLSSRIFTQLDSAYVKDKVKEIDDDFKQSLGVRWRIIDKNAFELSVTPAFSARYQDIPTVTREWQTLGSLFQDIRYQITDHITFYQESDISINPDAADSIALQFLARLKALISNRMAANLRYEIDFDENLAVGVDKTQTRIIMGMGYKF